MAISKKAAKAPAKKVVAKKAEKTKTSAAKAKGTASPTIEIRLSKAQVLAAEKCIQTTGKVRLSINEIVKTKLPKVITAKDVVVD